MSNMKPEDFRDGMRVTCNIMRERIDDAVLSIDENGDWDICNNVTNCGEGSSRKEGYKYSWCTFDLSGYAGSGVTNLRPGKQSHHRKPSPESELVGSCTLLKKWKWMVYGKNTCWLSTHKPEFLGVTVGFPGLDADWVEVSTRLLGRIAGHNYSKDDCLYRRQGDKWVHVG